MADKQDFDVDGRLLSQLRVVDLKQELEKRGLSKSGTKKDLMDRLRVQLQLESLQQQANQDEGHVPNLALQEDAMGEQSDLIKEYLSKQQKLYEIQKEARRRVELEEEEMKKQTPDIVQENAESTEGGQGDVIDDQVKSGGDSEESNEKRDNNMEAAKTNLATKQISGDGDSAAVVSSEEEKRITSDAVEAAEDSQEDVQPQEQELTNKMSVKVSEVDAPGDEERPIEISKETNETDNGGNNLPLDNTADKSKDENYADQASTPRSLRPRLRRDVFHAETEAKEAEHSKDSEPTSQMPTQTEEESVQSSQQNRVKLRRDASSSSSSSSRSQSPGVLKKNQETSSNGSSSRDQSPSESISSNGTSDLKTSRFKSSSKNQGVRSETPSEPTRKSRRLNRSQTPEEGQAENSQDVITTQAEDEEMESKVEDNETNDTEKPTAEIAMDIDSKSDEATDQQNAENVKDETVKPAPKVHVRKLSLTSSKEALNKENLESPSEGDKPVRKRKWGSSTANANKKTSIAISTDSLKCLIPDVKPLSSLLAADNALDFNEGPLSDTEDSRDNLTSNKEVRIVRTITQTKKEGENDSTQNDEKRVEDKTTTYTKPLSLMDEPVNRAKSPSPARNPVSRIVHIRNLVRPFTINQLKELLGRTGTLIDEGFWTDKIKSKCYATYETQDQAMKTRQTLHGTQWPPSNPKNLIVDFADDDELQFHMSLTETTEAPKVAREIEQLPRENLRRVKEITAVMPKPKDQKPAAPPPPIREWDRVKIGERSPGERERRKRSMSPQTARDRKREKGREGKEKREKKDRKKEEEAPAKLLDDLFKKTKCTPCIYWLPLTLEQIKQREEDRKKRQVEREKRRQLIKKESSVEKERSPVSRDPKKPKRPEEPRSRKRSASPSRSRPRKR